MPKPPPVSPGLLIGLVAGSAIAVSGLVAAGVIVFLFGGVRQASSPATAPAVVAAAAPTKAAAEPPHLATVKPAIEPADEPEPVAEVPGPVAEVPEMVAGEAAVEPKREQRPETPMAPAAKPVAAIDTPTPPPTVAPTVGDDAPPPGTAAAAAALVAELPAAIDVVRPNTLGIGAASRLDLGACSPAAAGLLELALAQPTALWPDESGRLRLTPSDPPAESWRIEQVEPGGDEQAARSVATVAVKDGRLTVAPATALPPPTARMLARSVLLVRLRGAGEWKPVRLLRPGTTGHLQFATLEGERARLPLPLPGPFAGLGLPPGSRIEVIVNDDSGELSLEPARERADEAFGMDLALGELTDGTKLVVRLQVEPRHGEHGQPLLTAETGIVGLEGKRSHERARLAKLLALGKTRDKVLAETFSAWDRAVEGLIRKPVNGVRAGEVQALLAAPLPMPQRLPQIPVSLPPLGKEFEAYLARNLDADGLRRSSSLPVSRADWEQEWQQVLRSAAAYYPGYVEGEWSEHFQRPLRAWWDDYRPKAVAQVTEAADEVAAMATRDVRVDVQQVAVDAVGPGGTRYVVPLLDQAAGGDGTDAEAAARDAAIGAGRPTGLD